MFSHILVAHNSITMNKCCCNAKPSAYYFYVRTKISVDFQICISVLLISFDREYFCLTLQHDWFTHHILNHIHNHIIFYHILQHNLTTYKIEKWKILWVPESCFRGPRVPDGILLLHYVIASSLWIHLTILVKSVNTKTFYEEKSAYFWIWNILFLLW